VLLSIHTGDSGREQPERRGVLGRSAARRGGKWAAHMEEAASATLTSPRGRAPRPSSSEAEVRQFALAAREKGGARRRRSGG
jgi:hypothetical protein